MPRWARGLDLLCLVLAVFALVVAGWGGFRGHLGSFRLALTSPYRLLLAAALVAAVRHVVRPRPTIASDLSPRVAAAWRGAAAQAAAAAFVGTRPMILFVGYFAVMTIGYATSGRPPLRYSENELLNLQARWDAAWYMSIVVDGYRYRPEDPARQQNIVFFPALPIATRAAGRLFGGESPAFLWGGTLVVLVAFFWSLIYMFHLARDLLDDDELARWAVAIIAAYPFALFFSALYSESFFLLGSAGAFYHFRRREWVKAALWGLLVGLTRPNGCLLSIPLVLLAVRPWLPSWLAGGEAEPAGRGNSASRAQTLVPAIASAAAPGIGMLIFAGYVWGLTGDPLAWAEGHAAWGRQYGGLVPLATRYYSYIAESGFYVFTKVLPFETLNGLGALFVIATAIPVWRRFGLSYAAFILLNILVPLAAGGLLSAGRFSAVLFPAFIWFASVVPVAHRPAWLGSFMALQGLNAALFYTWHEMF